MDRKIFDTDLVSLSNLEKNYFVIPSYQRPYVWGDIEVKQLLLDFYHAFKFNSGEPYYLGTILTKENGLNGSGSNEQLRPMELIDGQQRFTTLWLIAFAFYKKGVKTELTNILSGNDGKLRMSFEIRDEVRAYLNKLINPQALQEDRVNSTEHPYVKYVSAALATIEGLIDEKVEKSHLKAFGDYIYCRVKFIKNRTPDKLNLNKLFSTINSAGVQLEQTDIVKANLLNKLKSDKIIYARMWEACEHMDNFFERNVRVSFPESLFGKLNMDKYSPFNKDLHKYKSDREEGGEEDSILENNTSVFMIDDLRNFEPIDTKADNKPEVEPTSEEIYCESIINFGQLLLHTYRIHLVRNGKDDFEGTFHVNRLIEVFRNLTDEDEIKSFIELLWEVRWVFDKYVIKWVSDTNTKVKSLELVNISTPDEKGYYSRVPYEKSSILMLQSVLYYTGDYLRQYWLTPFLHKLLDMAEQNYTPTDEIMVVQILEKIDNTLSLADEEDKVATFMMMNGEKILFGELDTELIINYFNESRGTRFQHYWFQKLEYLLWKDWDDRDDEKFKNYRILSRNSVEHIYPQNEAKIKDEHLHSFGNLVLLSVSQNSEYSDKPVSVKREMFNNKRETFDTLKSYYIFRDEKKEGEWTTKQINNHKEEMMGVILKHYENNNIFKDSISAHLK